MTKIGFYHRKNEARVRWSPSQASEADLMLSLPLGQIIIMVSLANEDQRTGAHHTSFSTDLKALSLVFKSLICLFI